MDEWMDGAYRVEFFVSFSNVELLRSLFLLHLPRCQYAVVWLVQCTSMVVVVWCGWSGVVVVVWCGVV